MKRFMKYFELMKYNSKWKFNIIMQSRLKRDCLNWINKFPFWKQICAYMKLFTLMQIRKTNFRLWKFMHFSIIKLYNRYKKFYFLYIQLKIPYWFFLHNSSKCKNLIFTRLSLKRNRIYKKGRQKTILFQRSTIRHFLIENRHMANGKSISFETQKTPRTIRKFTPIKNTYTYVH